ncbi:hypothetical protein EVA_02755 [gut metagenome]|uniref:Uncharacterized protein n=1 Tax=gut metagenome TaxID=749906 RepID=J9GNE4_9ZZZZ
MNQVRRMPLLSRTDRALQVASWPLFSLLLSFSSCFVPMLPVRNMQTGRLIIIFSW